MLFMYDFYYLWDYSLWFNYKIKITGISRSIVEASPAHYIMKIKSFSLLTKNSIEIYESGKFEAGGLKWYVKKVTWMLILVSNWEWMYVKNVLMSHRKLVLHPSGNKSKNVRDHISLYLVLEESSSLHPGWEIYVNFKLFLFDHNNDNYLVVQGIYFSMKNYLADFMYNSCINYAQKISRMSYHFWFTAFNRCCQKGKKIS